MILQKYRAQVDLLLQMLPYVAKEQDFALKGGTAINLFVRDLPRLSVDIDLTFLPFYDRDSALLNIQNALGRIKTSIERTIAGINIITVTLNHDTDVKLNCQYKNAQIKIEVNTVTRGHFLPTRLMQISDQVQNEFKKFAAIRVVSNGELYGGKICAALDRQHPRDLFDVRLLLDNEGFDDEIRLGLLVSLLSHYKPIHELINPIQKDQKSAFETQFAGMSQIPFSYTDYENTRDYLFSMVKNCFTKDERNLLYGFEKGDPDWTLLPYESIKTLPAVAWKQFNINNLIKTNPVKHRQYLLLLEKLLF